jgi:hypothetical protein
MKNEELGTQLTNVVASRDGGVRRTAWPVASIQFALVVLSYEVLSESLSGGEGCIMQ